MSRIRYRLFAAAALLAASFASSADLPFNVGDTYAVGGWQEREEINFNAKGKQTGLMVVWMGVVGAEERDGIDYIWLETRMQEYKTKRNGDRKPKGDIAIMKSLVERSALTDFSNPMQNMRKFGKEIIVQNGDSEPIKMAEGGMMAGMAMNAFGIAVDFQIDYAGIREDVEVPAGNIAAFKIAGTGSAEGKVLIRKIKIESEVESWVSPDVPLAVVKQSTRSTTNGKVTTSEGQLLSYGDTGAESMIDDSAVQEMPSFRIPGL